MEIVFQLPPQNTQRKYKCQIIFQNKLFMNIIKSVKCVFLQQVGYKLHTCMYIYTDKTSFFSFF